jgi:hypothetical protein
MLVTAGKLWQAAAPWLAGLAQGWLQASSPARPSSCACLMMLGMSVSLMIFWEGLGMAKELCRRTFWVVLSLTTPFWP